MILEATTCVAVPATALWVHTVGITRILDRMCAFLYASARAYEAAKERYRAVYAETVGRMESGR